MLYLSEKSKCWIQLVNGASNIGAALTEKVPIHKGIFSNFFEDSICVLFNSLDLDFSHSWIKLISKLKIKHLYNTIQSWHTYKNPIQKTPSQKKPPE